MVLAHWRKRYNAAQPHNALKLAGALGSGNGNARDAPNRLKSDYLE